MSFSDIRDQQVPIRLLRNAIERNRIPNGLLLWGPSGVVKHLAALQMAKAVNCAAPGADPCDACLSCRKVDSGNHPDLFTVSPVKKSRIIDVAAIDSILEMASLRPYEGGWRVFLILEAERMRPPAQNHLLKTLEEPPGQALFILVSEQPQLLMPTIRSRCQAIRFGGLRPQTVKELLVRDRALDEEEADAIAAISQGQMSRAFDLIDSDRREIVFDIIGRLNDGEDPLSLSEEFAKYLSAQSAGIAATVKESSPSMPSDEMSRQDMEQIQEEQAAVAGALSSRAIMELLYLMESWYRDQLVYQATGDADRVLNRDQLSGLARADVSRPEEKIGAIAKARTYLERFLNEERVFRDLFFTLAR